MVQTKNRRGLFKKNIFDQKPWLVCESNQIFLYILLVKCYRLLICLVSTTTILTPVLWTEKEFPQHMCICIFVRCYLKELPAVGHCEILDIFTV